MQSTLFLSHGLPWPRSDRVINEVKAQIAGIRRCGRD
jgi:hypothetical protein